VSLAGTLAHPFSKIRAKLHPGTQHATSSRSLSIPDQLPSHQEASPSTTTLEPNVAVARAVFAVSDDLRPSSRCRIMELDVSSLGEVPVSGNDHAGAFDYHF
jgi:hypothetical protein